MEPLNAKPRLLKQANLSLIRKVMKAKGTATRAEIAEETGISSTTVRSLLSEMMENGEIESIGHDESSGGRKAERYRFQPQRYHGAVICITGNQIHGLLVNAGGEIMEQRCLEASGGDFEMAAAKFLDGLLAQKEIKIIGVGVPGVVDGGGYWTKDAKDTRLHKNELGEHLGQRYGLPVVLENDLNATAIGFGRREKMYPATESESTNMAYLYFEKRCIGAGFLVDGRVVRGSNRFAGELGLIPMADGRTLDEWMARPMNDAAYSALVMQIIFWICGILNPQSVVLSGPDYRRSCTGTIAAGLDAVLPPHLSAQIFDSPDLWQDYHAGMAYLTAEKMFDAVQFVKE